MNQKEFEMNRRTMLKAAGISLALPWMESLMGAQDKLPPRDFAHIFSLRGESSQSE